MRCVCLGSTSGTTPATLYYTTALRALPRCLSPCIKHCRAALAAQTASLAAFHEDERASRRSELLYRDGISCGFRRRGRSRAAIWRRGGAFCDAPEERYGRRREEKGENTQLAAKRSNSLTLEAKAFDGTALENETGA